MNWIELSDAEQVTTIINESAAQPVMIFKHSRRCNISRASLDRLERKWNEQETGNIKTYFLDILSFRDISNTIAQRFNILHESPQVLLIENGKSVLDLSHFDIDYDRIKSFGVR